MMGLFKQDDYAWNAFIYAWSVLISFIMTSDW